MRSDSDAMPEMPRKFASASVAYVKFRERFEGGVRHNDVAQVIVAVADDGTAWIHRGALDTPQLGWQPIVPLPPRTDG